MARESQTSQDDPLGMTGPLDDATASASSALPPYNVQATASRLSGPTAGEARVAGPVAAALHQPGIVAGETDV